MAIELTAETLDGALYVDKNVLSGVMGVSRTTIEGACKSGVIRNAIQPEPRKSVYIPFDEANVVLRVWESRAAQFNSSGDSSNGKQRGRSKVWMNDLKRRTPESERIPMKVVEPVANPVYAAQSDSRPLRLEEKMDRALGLLEQLVQMWK